MERTCTATRGEGAGDGGEGRCTPPEHGEGTR